MEYFYTSVIIASSILLAVPLGRYCSKVFKGDKTFLDFIEPFERLLFKLSGIDPYIQMDWKQNLKALLTINLIWFIWIMAVLLTQGLHPFWNPDNIPSMEPVQAFNTAVSFVTNTNLQHYSGETGVSYFTQMIALVFLQFVSAATGIAVLALTFKAFTLRSVSAIGNFYYHLVRACTRILLPLSVLFALILLINKVPMTFKGAEQIITLQGDTVITARGPVASMVAIKQLGTNGGGFFGTNSAHPFENPNGITNAAENIAIILLPVSLVFAMGFYLNRKKLSWIIFSVMTAGFLLMLIPTIAQETQGNPEITKMGISQPLGSMEGKETRFQSVLSALWSISTTVTSNGSVNSMHDSFTALSGAFQMLGMQLNAFYGGVGVGFLNMFIFIIVAVFISGLMVGRTPEFLGKKIEAREIKIAVLVALLHPFLILGGAALASHIWLTVPDAAQNLKWLNNPGPHGFSEMLYEFTSAGANNGSGFEGLGDNTPFWNISTGIIMLLGRYIPIIGPVMIAGLLSQKKYIPQTAGTLKIDSAVFGVMLFCVILVTGALLFIPSIILGPVTEYLQIIR